MNLPSKDKQDIIDCLKKIGKANYEKIATELGWSDKSKVSRRIADLRRDGRIVDTGEMEKTTTGKKAIVYSVPEVIVPKSEEKKRKYTKYNRPFKAVSNPLFNNLK